MKSPQALVQSSLYIPFIWLYMIEQGINSLLVGAYCKTVERQSPPRELGDQEILPWLTW